MLEPGQVSPGWFDNSSFHGEVTINMSCVYRHLDFSKSENYIPPSSCIPFFPYMSLITSSSWYRFGDFTLVEGANIFLHIFLSLVPCETQIVFDLGFFLIDSFLLFSFSPVWLILVLCIPISQFPQGSLGHILCIGLEMIIMTFINCDDSDEAPWLTGWCHTLGWGLPTFSKSALVLVGLV